MQVIDIKDLLVAVKESAQQAAIEEAKQEAKAATINTLSAQLNVDQKGTSIIQWFQIRFTVVN